MRRLLGIAQVRPDLVLAAHAPVFEGSPAIGRGSVTSGPAATTLDQVDHGERGGHAQAAGQELPAVESEAAGLGVGLRQEQRTGSPFGRRRLVKYLAVAAVAEMKGEG